MVLTIRPSWATSGDGPNDPRTGERLAIRRVAMPIFVEHGYDAVTIQDITAASGVSRRTFFRLFDGKNQIVSCDHEVYDLELHTHLLQHQGERTIQRAGKGAALILDSLTTVPGDAAERTSLLAQTPTLRAEESRWFGRHQATIATFLSDDPDATTVESEMTAAAIIAATRFSIRHANDAGGDTALQLFKTAIRQLTHTPADNTRQIALIETSMSIEDLIERLRNT